MTFNNWAFIYLGVGTEDPAIHRTIISHGGLETTIVAVPDPELAPQVAAELVESGAQSIELCGGFGPLWTARVIDAVEGRVPVGAVSYGVESVNKLARLFPSHD